MNTKSIFFLLCITLFSSNIFSQKNWTPKESMKIKSISQTDISNDGKYAAYVVREAIMQEKKSEYLNQIWVTNLVTKENYQYTYNLKSSMSPKFSPDGKKIAFLSSRSGKNQVWIMNTHGGEARKLTNEKKGVRSIKWSPDGKKISFLKNDEYRRGKKIKRK